MIAFFLLAVPALRQISVEERLKAALATVSGVRFSREDGSLVLRYRTEMVKAPRQSKSARVTTALVTEERPSLTGFKLETYDFPHRSSESPRPEQAVRMNPNWLTDHGTYKMDAVERQVDGAETGRYYYLLWGSNADPRVVTRIRTALETGTHPMRGRS